MTVETTDWEVLNAHADGELGPEHAAEVGRRLSADPQLAAEFARITALKSNLAALRPESALAESATIESQAPERHARPARHWIGAVAAVALVAAGLAYVMHGSDNDRGVAIDPIHAEFSQQTYFVDVERQVLVSVGASMGDLDAPDLSASNLALVDVRTFNGSARIALHYRGRRGCRVTLVVDSTDSTPFVSLDASALVYFWQTETRRFVLIAEGMDERRFAAIGNFAQAQSRASERQRELRNVLVESTEHARPCA